MSPSTSLFGVILCSAVQLFYDLQVQKAKRKSTASLPPPSILVNGFSSLTSSSSPPSPADAAAAADNRRKRSVPSGNKSRRVSFVDIVTSAGNKSRKVSFVDEVTGTSMGRMDLEGQEKIRRKLSEAMRNGELAEFVVGVVGIAEIDETKIIDSESEEKK